MSKAKDEVEDMFLFLAWFDPFYKPRKTSSNLITVDSGHEASENDDNQNFENKSDITETSLSDADSKSSNNFGPTIKAKLQVKKDKRKSNDDVTTTEVEVLQSIGASLGQKQTSSLNSKDEDELFGALIASQMRQIAPEREALAKMQISNILYQEMLASFSTMPVPYNTEQSSRKYVEHPQQQQ